MVYEALSYDEIKENIKTYVNFIHVHSKNDDSAYFEYNSVCAQANKSINVMMLHNSSKKENVKLIDK